MPDQVLKSPILESPILESRWLAFAAAASLAVLFAGAASAKTESDPLAVIRIFTRADGNGDRLQPRARRALAPRLAWPIEPAWDRMVLIRGVEFGSLQRSEDTASADVTYTVVGEIHGGVLIRNERLEIVNLSLRRTGPDAPWRIGGVPPPPHVFESNADLDAVIASVDPLTGTFVTNSVALHRILGESSDNPIATIEALFQSPMFEEVDLPESGDVAFYTNGRTAYHAGVVRPDGLIFSATVDRGLVALPVEAFPGEVAYRRIRMEPQAAPTISATESEKPAAAATASPETAATPAAAPL